MRTIKKYIQCIDSDIEFIVGSNAADNHNIIDEASPQDMWFHISGQPSCHVICKIPENIDNKKIIQKIAIQGAVVCKENSLFKSYKNVKIDYTRIKNVTKLDKQGSVIITNSKQIII